MKTLIIGESCSQQNLNTYPIHSFYLTFPKPIIISMKNQIKNEKFELKNVTDVTSNNPFPYDVHQIILGSLLGDMYCKKEHVNSKIEESHSMTQRDYLVWKQSILGNHLTFRMYVLQDPIHEVRGKKYRRKPQVRLRSLVSQRLNLYRELFYKDSKKWINPSVLNQLDTLGLAVWYCDDGYYDPENQIAEIHTEGYTIVENKFLKKWFKKEWNLDVNFKKVLSNKKVLIRFTVKDTNKFLNLIKDHIFLMPTCMWYKLGHIWNGNKEVIEKAKLNKRKRNKIYRSKEEVKSKRRKQAREFYHRHKERILKKTAEYRNTDRYKKYVRNYLQRKVVKQRMRKYQKIYRQLPGVKEKMREYNRKLREKRKRGGRN